ncbi:FixH family protein [Tropicimonas sp. IMCC34043]|uniref:FixH family protein n=1 Tax=Tropicimonas sp. IMCC34043 TaxID=2248760 RepID=UPI000E266DCC|nr:FixH family protein [Tropicimonas sp. IMCC34043]
MVLTGRKVLIITVSFFAVVIGVNLSLAFLAVDTFPGLESHNSYADSQTFDADRAAQKALGWTAEVEVDYGVLVLTFKDRDGDPIEVATLDTLVGRPTHTRDDIRPELSYHDGVYRGPVDLGAGHWDIHIVATASDGTRFKQRIPLHIVK